MRKLVLIGAIAAVAFACGTGADMVGEILDAGVPDAGAQPGDGTSMQYVGNSTRTFSGRTAYTDGVGVDQVTVQEGRLEYYQACQEDYGPGHRMCTRDEIIFDRACRQVVDGKRVLGVVPGKPPGGDRKVLDEQEPVMVWPHLLVRHGVAALVVMVIVLLLALLFNAPLREIANPLNTSFFPFAETGPLE